MSSALDRLKNLTSKISSYEVARKENIKRLQELFEELELSDKVQEFAELFNFKAVNLSAISLANESLGQIKEGKYLQILAILYDKDSNIKSKNISLAYYGKVENVDISLREKIIEFVLRFRFEKSFMTLEHYNTMLEPYKK